MPSGVADTYRCKKCSKKFKSLSEMRKHQWTHTNTYASVFKSAAAKLPVTAEISVRNFIENPHASGNGEMTVAQLLHELTGQRKFVDDMIKAISGITEHFQRTNAAN